MSPLKSGVLEKCRDNFIHLLVERRRKLVDHLTRFQVDGYRCKFNGAVEELTWMGASLGARALTIGFVQRWSQNELI